MSYNQHPERYNKLYRNQHPDWAGWRVIDEQKQKPRFPANLRDRAQLLEDLEFSYYQDLKKRQKQ